MKPRAAIAALESYRPPQERRAALRLDFNENTAGCAPEVAAALRRVRAEELAVYPAVEEAEGEIAAAFGHTPATCLLTNGTDDAILLTAMTYLEGGTEAVVFRPSFALYRFYAAQMGADVMEIELRERTVRPGVSEFFGELEGALNQATARTRAVFVARPNNPTGHAMGRAAVLELCRRLPQAMIFADEAYADFLGDGAESLLGEIGGVENLLVSRTFSKAQGLAGVRLGCLFGAPEAIGWLRRAHSPYNVSALAAVCGVAAVRAPGWARAFVREATAARGVIEATLEQLAIPYWRSQANFVLFDAGRRADALLAGMRAEGVLLRDRGADRAGAVRMSCGTVEQTRQACAALKKTWEGLA